MNDCEECSLRICKNCGQMMFHENIDEPCDTCVFLNELKEELNENTNDRASNNLSSN